MRNLLPCLAPLVVLAGCSNSPPSADDQSVADLSQILRAYQTAAERLGRPPRQPAELAPHLPPGTDPDGLCRRFVILWGTDPRDTTRSAASPLILGYAKQSRGGMRLVATVMGVFEMEEQRFQTGNFPAGHKP